MAVAADVPGAESFKMEDVIRIYWIFMVIPNTWKEGSQVLGSF